MGFPAHRFDRQVETDQSADLGRPGAGGDDELTHDDRVAVYKSHAAGCGPVALDGDHLAGLEPDSQAPGLAAQAL